MHQTYSFHCAASMAIRAETGHSALGAGAGRPYADRMVTLAPALTSEQLELLQRAHGGPPIWGGSVLLPLIRREAELLMALRLVSRATA